MYNHLLHTCRKAVDLVAVWYAMNSLTFFHAVGMDILTCYIVGNLISKTLKRVIFQPIKMNILLSETCDFLWKQGL